ncbi:MAG TPA: hypothetical protein VKD47_10780 [Miltoncostaeaceae bacterium]|nr:hypothetical protein [Miltoncostaeaceae bacterium]
MSAAQAAAFAPRGPAQALLRALRAARDAGADPARTRLLDWHGWVLLELPGIEPELGEHALEDAHPAPARARLGRLPAEPLPAGAPIPLPPPGPGGGGGTAVGRLAAGVGAHPVTVALALLADGWSLEEPGYPDGVEGRLGMLADPRPAAPEPEQASAVSVDDDPCPRRRHARRVLRRLLGMKKVGPGYHTEFDHLLRGAPADGRADARAVAEALIRAGLLGEKPSVGQRHVYLRREALPEIHALIDRGETDAPELLRLWTAPPPAGGPTGS